MLWRASVPWRFMDVIDLGEAVPTRDQALTYLGEAARRNPGRWEQHSHYVALGAECIARRHPGLDSERAYVLGLLHDIGRREGNHGMRHVLDGYRFCLAEGYPGVARVSLTHSYPIPGLAASAGSSPWDGDADGYAFVCRYLQAIEYNDYDRLIQLCDSLATADGLCLMEKRLMDVALRYGMNEHSLARWEAFFAIKAHFERAIGGSIYALLPDVSENTFA